MSSPEFYRNARAYDIAFGDRDFPDECNFLEWCLDHFGFQIDVPDPAPRNEERDEDHGNLQLQSESNRQSSIGNRQSFLELACGPARHAREFAKRGWRAVGLDLSPDMLEYACEGAAREGVILETVAADMTDFTLREPVALVANLMESLSHLVTNEQVVDHFRAVSRNLLPGGVFVIEMAHPDTIWRDSLPNLWLSRSSDSDLFKDEPYTEVDVLFGSADDPYDWITQQWLVTTRLTIREEGQSERVVEHHHPHRWYLAQELKALIDLSGAFSETRWYGNMVVPPPALDNSEASDRMIVVLRK
jgi:SAM-dependent methyltransferase